MNEWQKMGIEKEVANDRIWVDVAEVYRASNGQTYAIPCLSSPRCDAANPLLIAAPFGLL